MQQQTRCARVVAVQAITKDRRSNRSQMHPQLMGATSGGEQPYQHTKGIPSDDLKMGMGRLAAREHRHALIAMRRMRTQPGNNVTHISKRSVGGHHRHIRFHQ